VSLDDDFGEKLTANPVRLSQPAANSDES